MGADLDLPPFHACHVLSNTIEGVRMAAQLRDIKADKVKIGMPIESVFEDVSPDLTLPAHQARR